MKQRIPLVLIATRHALGRYQETHPEAGLVHLLMDANAGQVIPSDLAQALLHRRSNAVSHDPGAYRLSSDRLHLFACEPHREAPDAMIIVTALRLYDVQRSILGSRSDLDSDFSSPCACARRTA